MDEGGGRGDYGRGGEFEEAGAPSPVPAGSFPDDDIPF
jgi:hypothetical protein